MPFYRCIIPKDSLDYGERHKIAKAFTDVHCGISAAPTSFRKIKVIKRRYTKIRKGLSSFINRAS